MQKTFKYYEATVEEIYEHYYELPGTDKNIDLPKWMENNGKRKFSKYTLGEFKNCRRTKMIDKMLN